MFTNKRKKFRYRTVLSQCSAVSTMTRVFKSMVTTWVMRQNSPVQATVAYINGLMRQMLVNPRGRVVASG